MICPMSLSPSSLESRGERQGIFVTLSETLLRNSLELLPETYNRGHDILELLDILPNVSFAKSKTEGD